MADEKKKKEYKPDIKFGEGEKIWITFRFPKPSGPFKSKFGEFYSWGINKWMNDHWEEYNLKPTEQLRLLLLNMPIEVGPEYVIMKLKDVEGDFHYFEIWRRDEEPEPNVHSTKDITIEEKETKEPPRESGSKAPPSPQETELTDPLEVMQNCAVGVLEMVKGLKKKYPDIEISPISNMIDTLFINRMKNGY